MPQISLDLTIPLAHPITLTRGPGAHLVSLMDAAILIRDLEPWRQARPVWDRAAGLILLATRGYRRGDPTNTRGPRKRKLVEGNLTPLEGSRCQWQSMIRPPGRKGQPL